ncbi:hypothetical protein Pla144_37090 [Bythopirellula polymerisocia]|uniref:Uncharacterized protein n=1 Tax=Bythopirellula polymerisocia TaxID=2528003 RepID=A0A5C6CJ90_9BACT|nr:hypothetical protein Pla144_37090 [Bythopirellula polymerisocia]
MFYASWLSKEWLNDNFGILGYPLSRFEQEEREATEEWKSRFEVEILLIDSLLAPLPPVP